MIYIAVCDDERYMADQVSEMVSVYFRRKSGGHSAYSPLEIEVTQFPSGETLLRSDKTFDVLFLDIQMKDMDGMETARRLRGRGFKGYLIFITVLRETVFQSFEVGAYDYLVKPVEEQYFDKMMERLISSLQNDREKSLLVQRGYDSSVISFDEIIYCEIIGRKVYLHLSSGEVIDFYDRIENLQTRLDSRFYRCHRSYLINMKYLRGYRNGAARMEGGIEIPVSRLRSKEFSEAILRYMRK